LPPAVVQGINDGSISLTSPDTTIALLKLNAVVGLQGTVTEHAGSKDTLDRVGITCALCHSTVDNSFKLDNGTQVPGIGKRLDGWPNLQLNSGAIIALSPALDAATKAIFNSWGPGKYDPRFNLDGKNGPQVVPPAYGLAGINRITSTGDGLDVAYWNRYVGVTQMGGHGTFVEPRTGVSVTNGADANGAADLISSKLPALQAYQLSLNAPPPPAGSFDAAAAARGQLVFNGAGNCVSCHSGPQMTDANSTLHPASEVVSEPEPSILTAGVLVPVPSYASRSATKQYRTAPLHGLWQHAPYFHNGSAATLDAVVQTYNTKKSLGLSTAQMADLVQYLKSL
jgi:mono/diheme cytochrome c family protein